MSKMLLAALAALVLGGCATLPTFNPDNVAEDQLVTMAMRSTEATNYDTSFAIVAINGVPVEQELDAELIESNGRARVTGVLLPAGTHVLTVRLSNGHLGRRSLYHNQELDIEFTLGGASDRYELTRENSILNMGNTSIVLRTPGPPIPVLSTLMSTKIDEVEIAAVGMNRYEIVE